MPDKDMKLAIHTNEREGRFRENVEIFEEDGEECIRVNYMRAMLNVLLERVPDEEEGIPLGQKIHTFLSRVAYVSMILTENNVKSPLYVEYIICPEINYNEAAVLLGIMYYVMTMVMQIKFKYGLKLVM